MDDWEQAWADINQYAWPVARFLAWQEEWGIRHADGITAASRWLESRAQSYAPTTPVHYLPNGVTLPPVAKNVSAVEAMHTRDTQPSVLYYSRFVEVDPSWLARCWQTVLTHVPQAQLLVAGTPLQPGLDAPFHAAVADRLREAFAGQARARGTTMTIGIADLECLPPGGDPTSQGLIDAADQSLLEAKRLGRNRTALAQRWPGTG